MGLLSKLETRQYAAAKVTRLTGDWLPVNQDINTIIRNSAKTIKARTRQLVRDFPYFNRAINNLTNYTVGNGIKFQSRVIDDNDDFDKKAIRQIEDAIEWAYEELDASGKLHGHELERLSKRQDVESGELLFVKTFLDDPKRYIPYCLQAYEADWLTSTYSKPSQGNIVDQGIEYEPNTGKIVAYHFAVPSGFGETNIRAYTKTQRIPAEFVIHNFQTLRPGQLRGVSPFTTAILIAHDLGDYLDAEIDGAKMAAKYLAIVETGDIGGFQKSRTSTEENKKIESIENAIIEYLRPGEKINFAQHNRPGGAFEGFTKFCLRMVAVATDTTYELLSGDYDGVSFANLKGIRSDYAVMLKPHQTRHIKHVSQIITRDIIHWSVLSGKINLPGYNKEPRHYWAGVFTPPGIESTDLLRDGKAAIELIQACLMSPQEIVASRGRDFEEVLDEIAEAKKLMEAADVPFEKLFSIPTGMQNNPAALGATTNEKKAIMQLSAERGMDVNNGKEQALIEKISSSQKEIMTAILFNKDKDNVMQIHIDNQPQDINLNIELKQEMKTVKKQGKAVRNPDGSLSFDLEEKTA